MSFLREPLVPDFRLLDLLCGPDIAFDLTFLEGLLAGFGIDDRYLHRDLLDTVLAQCDGVADLDATLLNGLRKADTPDAMDQAVVGFDLGIWALFCILVIRPEFRVAGFDQFTGDTGGVIDTLRPAPFLARHTTFVRHIKIGPIEMPQHSEIGAMLLHHSGGDTHRP